MVFFLCVCVASPLTLGTNRKIWVFDSAAVQFSHHCCGAEWPWCLECSPSVLVTMLQWSTHTTVMAVGTKTFWRWGDRQRSGSTLPAFCVHFPLTACHCSRRPLPSQLPSLIQPLLRWSGVFFLCVCVCLCALSVRVRSCLPNWH